MKRYYLLSNHILRIRKKKQNLWWTVRTIYSQISKVVSRAKRKTAANPQINNAQTVPVLQYFLQIKVPDIILLSQLFSQLTSLHQ